MRHLAKPSRSMAPFQWYGGKGNMLKSILPHLTGGTVYVEPYCGAASLLFAQKPHPVEVINDLNGDVANVFRVLQDKDQFKEFAHRIRWTPYSLDEFRRAIAILKTSEDQLERAWAFFVATNQGMSGIAETEGKWSRAFIASRGMAHTTNKWRGRQSLLRHWHDRLTRVQIDNRDALQVIKYWDSPDTLYYADPPYCHSTRVSTADYAKECDDNHHKDLVGLLLGVEGRVVLSGYRSDLYEPLEEAGWQTVDIQTACHAAGKNRNSGLQGKGAALEKVGRTETLWINRPPDGGQLSLF